jgi:uridylate kinase
MDNAALRGKASRWFVVSLGGSLVAPSAETIDRTYLKRYASLLLRLARKGHRTLTIVGGGYPARWYQQEAKTMGVRDGSALDWIGIYATHLNASLLLSLLGPQAQSIIGKQRLSRNLLQHASLLVGGGIQPGQSSDAVAVQFARRLGAARVVNASNILYVFERDPRQTPTARAFRTLRWDDYLSLIPREWKPGLSTPFDPIASCIARQWKIQVAVVNGKNLQALQAALEGKPFAGTLLGAHATQCCTEPSLTR